MSDVPPRRPATRAALAVAALAVAALALYVLLDALAGDGATFRHVDELPADRAALAGRTLRVAGFLLPDSLEPADHGLRRFVLHRNGASLAVLASPADLPPRFREAAAGLIVDGRFDGRGEFHATRVTTTCPSRYETAPR
jgi:cytochrome c-type biogenesis protein CcmE